MARGLRWRDVDLDVGQVTIRQSICHGVKAAPKSGHERVGPLTPDLVAALRRLRRRERDEAVSLTSKGKPWREFSLRKEFAAACKRVGLEGWRLHDLRHFFVTSLFRAGVGAPSVQALAGHTHLVTTRRYAHASADDLRDAVRRLGQQPKEGG